MVFIGFVVAPHMRQILDSTMGFDVDMPMLTRLVFGVGEQMPQIAAGLGAAALLFALWMRWVRYRGREQAVLDRLLHVPLIGPVIRTNLVARWCDAVGLGVGAGLDLPRAVDLAAQATGSPSLSRDSTLLLKAHDAGQSIKLAGPTRVLTPTVLAALDMGRQRGDLNQVMTMLAQMYQRTSEHYLGVAIAFFSPAMLILMGLMLGTVIAGMFLPLIRLIQNVSG
jgi:type IV pilus assembly protein PilC